MQISRHCSTTVIKFHRVFSTVIISSGLALTLSSAIGADGLTIVVTGAGGNRFHVSIPSFSGERSLPLSLTSVIRADLDRSGLFQTVDPGGELPESVTPPFPELKAQGIDAVATGSVSATANGVYETKVKLYDVPKQSAMDGRAFLHNTKQIRATAHRVSDSIFEKLTGERGIFSTRIAFVVKDKGRYRLQVADQDGGNEETALTSPEPIISPSWSPDGSRLAYVSFEAKKPIVYVHDVATGKRTIAAGFKGSNSAPAWSPDGRHLAVVLSKDGNSQLYVVSADGGGARRIASSSAIDTEPRYSPDGGQTYFTSDRGGSPQIYRVSLSNGNAERVSFEGSYNVTPRPSPDGKNLAYITRNNGRFQLVVMELASRQTMILTDTDKDESPSFAPNGKMILYATEIDGHGVLATTSIDGRVKQKYSVIAGDAREPCWGPFSAR